MIRTCLLCLFLLLTAGITYAQWAPWKISPRDTGKIYLRFSPLGLMDFLDGNFTVGGEYRFNSTWSATMDAGIIFYSQYMRNCEKVTGMLLRPGIRKYTGRTRDNFVDLQFHYKRVMYHVNDWIERGVVDDASAYEQFTTFRYRKQVFGIHLMWGNKQYLTKDRRLFLEIAAGFGIHYKITGPVGEVNSRFEDPFALVVNRNNNLKPVARAVVPALPITLRVVYRLK
jgi:hypothetical protein